MNEAWEKLRNPHCKDCDLSQTTKYVCLMGQGPIPCQLMIIGEAPGERGEDIQAVFR